MHWRPIYKGSKNPPLGTQILLRAYDGSWGIGIAYKYGSKVFFNYTSSMPTRGWIGMGKDHFSHWCQIQL